MLRSGLLGAVIALVLAGAAAAEPFQSFADMCLSTNADAHAAEVAAKGAGWSDVTAQMGADMGEEFQDVAAFLNFDPADAANRSPDDSMEILFTGRGDGETVMDAKGVVLDLCGVMSPQAEAQFMRKNLTDHLGMSASTDESLTYWLYSRQGDRFVSEAALAELEDDALLAATRERSLYVVYVFEEDGLTGLFVGAVRPEAKASDL